MTIGTIREPQIYLILTVLVQYYQELGDESTQFGIIFKLLKTIRYQSVYPPLPFEKLAEKVNQYYALIEADAWDSYYSTSTTESTGSEIDSVLSREMSATPTGDNTTEPIGEASKPVTPGFTPFSLNYQGENMYENQWNDDEAPQDQRSPFPPPQL